MLSNCFPDCQRDLNVDPLNKAGTHVGMIKGLLGLVCQAVKTVVPFWVAGIIRFLELT